MNKAYRGQFWKISLLKWLLWKVNPLILSLKIKECSDLFKWWIRAPRGLLDHKLPKFFSLKYIKTHTKMMVVLPNVLTPVSCTSDIWTCRNNRRQPLNNTIHCGNSIFNSAPAYSLAERVPGLTLTQWIRLKKYKMETSKEQWQPAVVDNGTNVVTWRVF